MQTNLKEQRRGFVHDYESGQWSMTELCQRFGVTRPTGYLWIARYQEEGESGLVERSRVPGSCPHRTPPERERRILALREKYGWGAKKLLQVLEKRTTRGDLAGAEHSERGPRAPRQAAQEPETPKVVTPGSRGSRDGAPEPGVAGGLQGSVQDARRMLLLPADRDRPLQP